MNDYKDILPILQEAAAVELRPKHISGLTGISETRLSRAKNGSEFLSPQEYLDVKNLVAECQELAARNILPVNWTDLRAVRVQLDAFRNEKRNPPKPPNEIDIEIFRRFVDGDDLDAVSFDFKISKEDILHRVELINARAEHIARIAK